MRPGEDWARSDWRPPRCPWCLWGASVHRTRLVLVRTSQSLRGVRQDDSSVRPISYSRRLYANHVHGNGNWCTGDATGGGTPFAGWDDFHVFTRLKHERSPVRSRLRVYV